MPRGPAAFRGTPRGKGFAHPGPLPAAGQVLPRPARRWPPDHPPPFRAPHRPPPPPPPPRVAVIRFPWVFPRGVEPVPLSAAARERGGKASPRVLAASPHPASGGVVPIIPRFGPVAGHLGRGGVQWGGRLTVFHRSRGGKKSPPGARSLRRCRDRQGLSHGRILTVPLRPNNASGSQPQGRFCGPETPLV